MVALSKSINNKIVLQVIERGLDSLGESPKQAIWFCLEEKFGFKRKEAPENIEEFQEALRNIFGWGYDFLDTLFRQYLNEATGEKFHNCASFAECVSLFQNNEATKLIEKPAT